MITGFQATLEVDDGGTGSASAGASTKFTGLVTLGLPSLEAPQFDATELDQVDESDDPDEYEREEPTGTIKVGRTKAEMKYTKANYLRLQKLVGKRGKTFKVITPDDQTSGTATKLTTTFVGNVSKLDELKFEKGAPVLIPFELTCSRKPAYT
jgi:hypothetical protein